MYDKLLVISSSLRCISLLILSEGVKELFSLSVDDRPEKSILECKNQSKL